MMPPERGDGPLVRHVFSIFSRPMPHVDERGEVVKFGVSPISHRESFVLAGGNWADDDRTFASKLDEENVPIVEGYLVDCQV